MNENQSLEGKKVAFIVTDGFEQVELTGPMDAVRQAGAEAIIVSPNRDRVKGWKSTDWGDSFPVDMRIDEAGVDDFDALVLPGGVMNPDKLRMNPKVVNFVRSFFETGKPLAAICHGPWTLIDAGVVAGRRMTSWPSLRTDLINAGAEWVDEEVVVENGLITSRKPDDIPAFNRKLLEEIREGVHAHA